MFTFNFSWLTLAIFSLLTVMFLYEAWVNLVHQKVSKFALDALLMYILSSVGTRRTKENVKAFPRNKTEIVFLGICAFAAGVKGLQGIYYLLQQYKP